MTNFTERIKNFQLNIIDIIYGVIFAYGFALFDRADGPISYLRLFFAFSILIIDWVYCHHIHLDKEYKKWMFAVDILQAFFYSRLLSSAVTHSNIFLFWLFLLFALFIIWDLINKSLYVSYDWLSSILADSSAAIIYLSVWLLTFGGIIEDNLLLNTITIIIFIAVAFAWFKKKKTFCLRKE